MNVTQKIIMILGALFTGIGLIVTIVFGTFFDDAGRGI